MTRRTSLALLAAAAASGSAIAKGDQFMFQQILEASLAEKKGVMLYVKGQSIPGIVTKVDAGLGAVELRSREYSKIVVKLESIDAVAMA